MMRDDQKTLDLPTTADGWLEGLSSLLGKLPEKTNIDISIQMPSIVLLVMLAGLLIWRWPFSRQQKGSKDD